jgi:rod shape-determining protein MreD
MLNKIIKVIILFIPAIIIQLVAVPLISISGIGPNIIVIFLVYFTLMNGQIFGTILGFICGFIFDLISGSVFGVSMLSMTISSFIAGYFYNEPKIEVTTTSFFFVFIVFLCASIESLVFSAVSSSTPDFNFIFLMVEGGILPGIFTAALSVFKIIFTKRKRFE